MTNSIVLTVLEGIKSAHGLQSNYKLARFLGIKDASLAHYVHGRSLPDEKTCFKIATAAGIDPEIFTARVQAMRSRDDETRSIWERVAARLAMASGTAAAVILSVLFSTLFIAPDAYAKSVGDVSMLSKCDQTSYTSWNVGIAVLFALWLASALRFDVGFLPLWVPTK